MRARGPAKDSVSLNYVGRIDASVSPSWSQAGRAYTQSSLTKLKIDTHGTIEYVSDWCLHFTSL